MSAQEIIQEPPKLFPDELRQVKAGVEELASILLLALSMLLAGCQRTVEVKGEIFSEHGKTVVRGAGTQIFILTTGQHKEFQRVLGDRTNELQKLRDSRLAEYRDLTNRLAASKRLQINEGKLPFFDSYRQRTGEKRSDEDIALDFIKDQPDLVERIPELKAKAAEIRTSSEETFPPQPMDLHDPAFKRVLENSESVVADSEGRFRVLLKREEPYWIVAGPWHGSLWHFRFTVKGQNLVLSEGNSVK